MKPIIQIGFILAFSWFITCASGQTTQPQETPSTEDNTAQERNLNLFEVGKELGFIYAPYGKGWEYKDVRLDPQDFQKWFDQHKDEFMGVINALDETMVLEVVGHTDESGPQEAQPELGKKGNIWYSTQRALRVCEALKKAGIPENKLKCIGVGESEHIPGIDPYDQRQRRVTFKVGKKNQQ